MSSDVSVLPNCWSKVLLGGAILRSLFIENCPKAVSEEIQDSLSNQERQWPPTQQEVLEEKNMSSNHGNLFNLITLIH